MKIDEILKRLENVQIGERYEIVGYLVQTVVGDKWILFPYNLVTKDKTIYDFGSYEKLLKSNKVSPNDVYVYVKIDYFTGYNSTSYFYYPFLVNSYLLLNAYLSKLGLKADLYHIAPATELRYVAIVGKFAKINRVVVELADIDNVATNTHLPTLIYGDVRNKHIDDEVDKILSGFLSQKLFAGYDFIEAGNIISRYYKDHDTSLAKEVKAIRDAYNRIFKPYRVEYDLKIKRFISSSR
jgi:hypothetical protein